MRPGPLPRALAVVCAAIAWLAAPAALAQTPPPAQSPSGAAAATAYEPVQQEELYLAALREIASGNVEDANALLLRFLEKEPRHAGAWLELALSQCSLGNAAEAERLFKEIIVRFTPPPGIMEVIQDQRQQGCHKTVAPVRDQWSLAFARGYDSNVNQGASNATFHTGSGSNELEWQLEPDYLPKPDHYSQLTGDYSSMLSDSGLLAFGQLRARRNDQVHQQDAVTLLAGLEHPWKLDSWHGRGTVALSAMQLDGHYYQRQAQLQLRATPPLKLPEQLDLSFSTGLNHVTYPTRTKYDSNTLELGATLRYRGGLSFGQAAMGMLSDKGQNGRLGGDRLGWYGSVLVDTRLGERLTAQAGASRQVWRSSALYSPGLIDVARHQDTQQLNASANWQLMAHHSLQLEWRAVRNRENIGLFQYNSRMLQLSWRWDNF